ncbi:MAG: hypothetical protein WCN81_16005, partial [Actinomycetes bacterium]
SRRSTDGRKKGLLQGALERLPHLPDGVVARCTTSPVLRSLATDERHPVAAGDWVLRMLGSPDEEVRQAAATAFA